ncbi:hypothetical protein ACLK29_18565, partial [Leptospira kirschneri]
NLWELRQILCKTEFPPHNAIHRERCAEFNFDSKILFNLWGWYGRERSAGFPASISFALTYVNLWTAQLNVNSVGSCSEKVV